MNEKQKQKVREEKMKNFNPNENGLRNKGIFGLPFEVEESELVLLPVPWEVTVSYSVGAGDGPKAILDASLQIDLYDSLYPKGWQDGIAMEFISEDLIMKNKILRTKTEEYLKKYGEDNIDKELGKEIDKECGLLNDFVEEKTTEFLNQNKIVGVVGGDHSVILGYLKALSKKHNSFGILQIDAHMDLRKAYEGLEYSHASIFYNVFKLSNIKKLVQVGIRDFCEEENNFVKENENRIKIFTDYEIKKNMFLGSTWEKECDKIIAELPENVYISFDIDGLDPSLCPNTGTPVPGGFKLEEIIFLFEKILASGKKIIGFDLCEVAPGKEGEWDGNVGARVLYKLCLLALKSKFSQ